MVAYSWCCLRIAKVDQMVRQNERYGSRMKVGVEVALRKVKQEDSFYMNNEDGSDIS